MATEKTGSAFEWQQIYKDGYVHLLGLVLCAASTVLLTKISSFLAPFNLYFTFTDLVKSGDSGYGFLPFVIKLLIPFTVGFAYFQIFKNRDAKLALVGDEKKINLELTAGSGAALGALLLSWPAIVLWEFVVSPTIYTYRVQFVLVYLLYITSFAWVSFTGVTVARVFWVQDASRAALRDRFKTQYQFAHIVYMLIVALGTGGIADWASRSLAPQ